MPRKQTKVVDIFLNKSMKMSKVNDMEDFDDFFDDPIDRNTQVSNNSGDENTQMRAKSPTVPLPERRSRSISNESGRSRSLGSQRSRSYSRSTSRSRSRSYSSRSRSRSSGRSASYRSGSRSPVSSHRVGKSRSRSRSYSPHHSQEQDTNKEKIRRDEYESDASYGSDVTDVSPINTPKVSSEKFQSVDHKPPNSGSRRTYSGKMYHDELHQDDDVTNMKLLMDVLELETSDTRRKDAHDKKVSIGPKTYERKNYSFSNDQVKMIDTENQRLMDRLVNYAPEPQMKQQTRRRVVRKANPVLTSSAINRHRHQEKIERENLAFLRRLQETKATKNLRRDKLLHDYQGTMLAGQSVAAAHVSCKRPSDTYTRTHYHDYSDYHDIDDFTEAATVVLNESGRKQRSRPASATVRPGQRPTSGKMRPVSAKSRNSDTHEWR